MKACDTRCVQDEWTGNSNLRIDQLVAEGGGFQNDRDTGHSKIFYWAYGQRGLHLTLDNHAKPGGCGWQNKGVRAVLRVPVYFLCLASRHDRNDAQHALFTASAVLTVRIPFPPLYHCDHDVLTEHVRAYNTTYNTTRTTQPHRIKGCDLSVHQFRSNHNLDYHYNHAHSRPKSRRRAGQNCSARK